ncbi:MAG: hypothetical protein RLZZ396_1055, partial [Planctomycetota bacterium]
TVGLRRKTGLYRLALQRLLVGKVLFDFDFNEVFVVMRLWVFRWMGHDAWFGLGLVDHGLATKKSAWPRTADGSDCKV